MDRFGGGAGSTQEGGEGLGLVERGVGGRRRNGGKEWERE